MRSGIVYVQNRKAGLLEETDSGFSFTYFPEYRNGDHPLAVSLTLPVQEEPYFSDILFPFFDGLIPEGWQYDLAIDNWKLAYNDRFGVLLRTARDPIGDVFILPEHLEEEKE